MNNKFREFFGYQKLEQLLIAKINEKYPINIKDIRYNSFLKNDKAIPDLFMDIKQNVGFIDDLKKLKEKNLICNLGILNPFLIEFDYDEMNKNEKNLYLKIYKNFE